MLIRSIVLVACFALGTVLVARADRREEAPARMTLDDFPMSIGEWRGVQQQPFEPEILAVLGVDDYLTRVYLTPDRAGVGVYIGYYTSQRRGDTMHSPLNCLPGSGWEPLSNTRLPISVADSLGQMKTIEVNRYIIQKGLDRQLVLYWYQTRGRAVASEYWSKFFQVTDAVHRNRTDGALVRVMTPILEHGEGPAEALAARFVQSVFPLLPQFVPE